MKKFQEFLLWFVCFAFIDMISEFIKISTENSVLNKWAFVLFGLIIFIVCWTVVFLNTKQLKNEKKNKRWLTGFICFTIVWSVYMTFDVIRYSLENNMLNIYYFFGIGTVLMFTGYAVGRLENILPKLNNKRRKN